jgi:hypothetical protein
MTFDLDAVVSRVRQQDTGQFVQPFPGSRFEGRFIDIEQDVRQLDDQSARLLPCFQNLRERLVQSSLYGVSLALGFVGLETRLLGFSASQCFIGPRLIGVGLSLSDPCARPVSVLLRARNLSAGRCSRFPRSDGLRLRSSDGLLSRLSLRLKTCLIGALDREFTRPFAKSHDVACDPAQASFEGRPCRFWSFGDRRT